MYWDSKCVPYSPPPGVISPAGRNTVMRSPAPTFARFRARGPQWRTLVVALASMGVGLAATTSAMAQGLPYQDPSLPIPTRVNDLLGRMSLDEKIGQMTQAERA